MAKVTYSEGRKQKGPNKLENVAKVTNTGGRKPKGLTKIDKMAKVTLWFSPSGIGDLS
jgi:hypothetical protein